MSPNYFAFLSISSPSILQVFIFMNLQSLQKLYTLRNAVVIQWFSKVQQGVCLHVHTSISDIAVNHNISTISSIINKFRAMNLEVISHFSSWNIFKMESNMCVITNNKYCQNHKTQNCAGMLLTVKPWE